MANNKAVTIVPSNTDIVSGRGRGFEKRKGNKMFRKLINSHSTVYSDKKTTRSQKGQIVQSIWALLSMKDMRMLKQINGGDWVEMSKLETKKKIALALRDAKVARKMSSQTLKSLTALDNYNAMAYKQILGALPEPTLFEEDRQHLDAITLENNDDENQEEEGHSCEDYTEWQPDQPVLSIENQEVIDSFLGLDMFPCEPSKLAHPVLPPPNSFSLTKIGIPRVVSTETNFDDVDTVLDCMIADEASIDEESGSVPRCCNPLLLCHNLVP